MNGPFLFCFHFRCSRQCLQSFSDESKQQILSNFNAFGDQKAQDAYLTGGISTRPVQRRRSRGGGGEVMLNVVVTCPIR